MTQVPDIPWLSGLEGVPDLDPDTIFDAYLAYFNGSHLEGIDLFINTNLTQMTAFASTLVRPVAAIIYPAGEYLAQIVKEYQLRPDPQWPNLHCVPTYKPIGTEFSPRELEVNRLMQAVLDDDATSTMYQFFPPQEYDLYWSRYADVDQGTDPLTTSAIATP